MNWQKCDLPLLTGWASVISAFLISQMLFFEAPHTATPESLRSIKTRSYETKLPGAQCAGLMLHISSSSQPSLLERMGFSQFLHHLTCPNRLSNFQTPTALSAASQLLRGEASSSQLRSKQRARRAQARRARRAARGGEPWTRREVQVQYSRSTY